MTTEPITLAIRRISPVWLLIITSVIIYGVTARFRLLNTLDDMLYLLQNETIKEFSLATIRQAFSEYYLGNYAPVHMLSYMVDHLIWGFNPVGYHLENVLIHTLNGLLFYVFLRRLSQSKWQATAASWIFMFHPAQVETVAWVSQRKNLLAMFFFLLALLAYQAFAARKSNKAGSYLLSIVAVVAAMLSKSVAVIFPAIILLYDVTYARDSERSITQRLKDNLPYVFAAVVVAVLTVMSQSYEMGGGRRDFPGGSPSATFYTMVPVLLSYVRDCFWPFDLSPYYMVTIRQQPDTFFVLSLLAVAMLGVLGAIFFARFRPLLFWYGLFFIALLPVLQFIPLITLKNDRYLYFPLLGFSVLIVQGAMQLQPFLTSAWRKVALGTAVLIMVAIPLQTFKQTLCWRDDISIWTRAVEVDSENRLAWLQLAKGYTIQNDAQHAISALKRYHDLRAKYGFVRGFEGE